MKITEFDQEKLKNGMKIRMRDWNEKEYIYYNKDHWYTEKDDTRGDIIGSWYFDNVWYEYIEEPKLLTYDEFKDKENVILYEKQISASFPGIPNLYSSNVGKIKLFDLLTEKEKIRRYIQYLADTLNGEWKFNPENNNLLQIAILYRTSDKKFVISIDSKKENVGFVLRDEIYFKNDLIAQKVIDIAEKELKILFGVE